MQALPLTHGHQAQASRFFLPLRDEPTSDTRFAAVLGVVFLLLLFVMSLRHELWRDEIELWMVGKRMTNLHEVQRVLKGGFHTYPWYGLLTLLSLGCKNPFAMQVLHALLATAAVYIFLRYAPLHRLHKALCIFGFFPFYQYGVVSRCYVLGILLTFVVLAFLPFRRRRLWTLALLLGALANTSAFGVILAVCLTAVFGMLWLLDRRAANPWRIGLGQAAGALALVAVGVIVALIQIRQPGERSVFDATPWGRLYFHFTPQKLLTQVSTVYLYSLNLFPALQSPSLSLVLLLVMLGVLARKPAALVAYVLTTGTILMALFVKQHGFLWHVGHLWIALLLALWIGGYYAAPRETTRQWSSPASLHEGLGFAAVALLFGYQLLPSAYAAYLDYTQPFSCGKLVADYARQNRLDSLPIAGDVPFVVTTVAGYLDKPIYRFTDETALPATGRDGDAYRAQLKYAHAVSKLLAYVAEQNQDVLLVLSYPLEPAAQQAIGAEFQRSFEDCQNGVIEGDHAVAENYWVYVIRIATLPAARYCDVGERMLQDNAIAAAARLFEAALRREPNVARAHYGLGLVRFRQGQHQAAVDEFQTALRLDPRHDQARHKLGLAQAAVAAAGKGGAVDPKTKTAEGENQGN